MADAVHALFTTPTGRKLPNKKILMEISRSISTRASRNGEKVFKFCGRKEEGWSNILATLLMLLLMLLSVFNLLLQMPHSLSQSLLSNKSFQNLTAFQKINTNQYSKAVELNPLNHMLYSNHSACYLSLAGKNNSNTETAPAY
jgi:hypothetical protein